MEDVEAVFMTTLYAPVKGRACGRLRKVGWHKTGGGYQCVGQPWKGGAGTGGFETLPALLLSPATSTARHLPLQQSQSLLRVQSPKTI